MSFNYISDIPLTEFQLIELRDEYLLKFKSFKKEYIRFLNYYNKINESFYGESIDKNFLIDIPNDCDVDIMYEKLKNISDALKDFHIFVKS